MEGDIFNVGDQVVVRDWDEMASAYGVVEDNKIAPHRFDENGNRKYSVGYFFMPGMKPMCNTIRTIEKKDYDSFFKTYRFSLNDEDTPREFGHWRFEPWMLRHVDESVEESVEVPDEDFMAMLVGT